MSWHHSQAQALYDHVDTLLDSNPNKAKLMTKWIHGEPIIGSKPPKVKKLKTRIHVWQVNPDLMTANYHWLTTGQVASNGKAWGDAEEPVDVELEAAKERKAKLVNGKQRKQIMQGVGAPSTKKACLDEILDGQDEDAFFET